MSFPCALALEGLSESTWVSVGLLAVFLSASVAITTLLNKIRNDLDSVIKSADRANIAITRMADGQDVASKQLSILGERVATVTNDRVRRAELALWIMRFKAVNHNIAIPEFPNPDEDH